MNAREAYERALPIALAAGEKARKEIREKVTQQKISLMADIEEQVTNGYFCVRTNENIHPEVVDWLTSKGYKVESFAFFLKISWNLPQKEEQ